MNTLKIEYRATNKLTAYAGNARQHSPAQVQQIINSITQFGFTNPILVDEQGEVIAGHGRLLAAQEMLMPKVPVIVLRDLSEEQKRALRLADNKIQQNSTWDMQALAAELAALQVEDFDLSLTGFNEAELDALLAEDADIIPSEPVRTAPEQQPAEAGSPAEPRELAASEDEEDEQDQQPSAPTPAEPKAADDEYSTFQLIMLHENKLKLVDVLNEVKQKHHYEKQEDALMHILREFSRNA